jgi:hypothetical protein
LLLGALALRYGFDWVGKPLARANLGSILCLQLLPRRTLALWRDRLTLRAGPSEAVGPGPASLQVAGVLRKALWRDCFGFIPLYTLLFALAAWFATRNLGKSWNWLARPVAADIELWHALVAGTAALDLLENALHFTYARRFSQSKVLAGPLLWLGPPCSCVKNLGFLSGVALLAVVLGHTSWMLARDGAGGWRATIVLLGVCAIVPAIAVSIVSVVVGMIRIGFRGVRTPEGT